MCLVQNITVVKRGRHAVRTMASQNAYGGLALKTGIFEANHGYPFWIGLGRTVGQTRRQKPEPQVTTIPRPPKEIASRDGEAEHPTTDLRPSKSLIFDYECQGVHASGSKKVHKMPSF